MDGVCFGGILHSCHYQHPGRVSLFLNKPRPGRRPYPLRALSHILLLMALFAPASPASAQRVAPELSDTVTISAGFIHHNNKEKKTTAQNGVEIDYQGRVITGDVGVIDHETGAGYLAGGVRMREKEAVIDGEKVEFNLRSGVGQLHNAQGRLGEYFYFTGENIQRLAPDHYILVNGSCSTCALPDQDWRIEASHVDMTMEYYAFIQNMVFRAGDVPIFYLPYFIMPTKTKRATGLLIPEIGYSQENGFNISNHFFWAMTDYMDATITHHHRGNDGEGGDLEFRYIFSETTRGTLNTEYFYILAPEEARGTELWKLKYNHNQLLPFGVENVIQADMESEASIARRWEDDLASRTRRYSDSFFLMRKNWISRSLSLTARTKRSVVPGMVGQVDELPSILFTNQKESLLGLPLYWSLESGYTYFSTKSAVEETGDKITVFDVGRLDVFPGISAVLSPAPWLSLEPELKYRSTMYSAWVDENGDTVEEPFVRSYYSASTVLTGPRFYRIFDFDNGEKFKHLVTPRISWNFIPDFTFDGENRQKVKVIDAVDMDSPKNEILFTLVNQGLYKERVGAGGEEFVSEMLKLSIEQRYDFNEATREETAEDPRKPFLPTMVDLKTRPADWLMFNVNGEYDFTDAQLDRTHIELGIKVNDLFHFALDRVTKYPDAADQEMEIWDTAYLEFILPGGVRADFSAVYNETEAFINDGAVRLFLKRGCWGIGLSGLYKKKIVSDSPDGPVINEETKIMLSIDLLGLGDTLGEVAQPLAGRKI